MLTSNERRDLEAYWTEERMIRTAAYMKASVLAAAVVGLFWLGFSAEEAQTVKSAVAATPQDSWRPAMIGISAIHARQVFDERRAQGTEDDMVPAGGLLGETRYMTAESGASRPFTTKGLDQRASR